MKKTYYELVGDSYVPALEYDSDLLDAAPEGAHLLLTRPGGVSRRFNINPAYAPMIAAGSIAENAMVAAMVKASELKPARQPLTPGQVAAWENLAQELGDERATLNGASAHAIIEAGIAAMQAEADKLLKYPAVKQAYDEFMLVAELTKEQNV